MNLAYVWIEYNTMQIDRPFTYLYEDELVQRGIRVLVPFNNRLCVGFVEEVIQSSSTQEELEKESGYKLLKIESILDREPLINEELFDLAKWMAKETVSSTISCFQAMLPAKLKPISSHHHIKMETWIKVSGNSGKLTLKQQIAYDWIKLHQQCSLTYWRKEFKGAGKALEEKQIVIQFQKEATYKTIDIATTSGFELTPDQQQAKDKIESASQNVVLLHGVTGSGKTEVYLQMAQKVVANGKQVLILVPEISLTPQMVKRVQQRFGHAVAIYHSGLNNQEKYEQFVRVKHNEVNVVVGTRSAVFMPFTQLGLIILDEEHDASYKQDSSPQYHCRDVAIARAQRQGCKVVLGSATPSLESYARATKQVYGLAELSSRINNQLPVVKLIDTQLAMRSGQSYILTNELKDKIQTRLLAYEQTILLLNRRGYSPTMRCNQCKETIMCNHCDVALSYHRAENVLKCHCCGIIQNVVKECPSCHHRSFSMLGVGTQRLVEEVEKAFPEARIIRMDADTTTKKNAHQKILEKVENHEVDILIGTQMIAKGMDYPEVTLVGIINGDAGLNHTDFHSVESTFQLIVQASGRSGRAIKPGEVIIQAFDPSHYAIQYGARQDYHSFFKHEMNYRHQSNNPPYTYLFNLVFSHPEQSKVCQEIDLFNGWIRKYDQFKVLGPSELFKVQDQYRYRLILKGKDRMTMLNCMNECLAYCQEMKFKSKLKVDTCPMVLD